MQIITSINHSNSIVTSSQNKKAPVVFQVTGSFIAIT